MKAVEGEGRIVVVESVLMLLSLPQKERLDGDVHDDEDEDFTTAVVVSVTIWLDVPSLIIDDDDVDDCCCCT